ncbi:hypothetical protein [Methylotenera versatilis]|uniref:hypothetical protein n=1 Tax=Methylotenera versatilis TaxID=1055487 RepID=UPI00064696DD|nr:hypothetical protein [Methylotenera versatilis]
MTIKNTVYSAHQRLKDLTNPPVKLTHVYELLAAAFGFNSYASLKRVAILTNLDGLTTVNQNSILQKANSLGYQAFPAGELVAILEEEGLGTLTFSELAVRLSEYNHFIDDDLDQLIAADTNAWANYCLALHCADSEEDDSQIGSEYWYQQMQAGRQLSGIEKTWALEYKEHLANGNKYEYHLRKAALLGCDLALLDLAEKFDDATFFEGDYQNVTADPMRVAEIAHNLGRYKDQHHWLTVAAEAGNIEAMRELIESFDSKDLTRCWTWIYLSQLLDNDLTIDHHYAIHENGSEYDYDVGGPMYADGLDGISLESLEKQQDALARFAAEAIFKKL